MLIHLNAYLCGLLEESNQQISFDERDCEYEGEQGAVQPVAKQADVAARLADVAGTSVQEL